ncbi:MAG: SRPBCC domain-containing protein [Nannocystaceae bacterium]|nr:SRPBCC domain-containing protein [Nannocystaceae bacterium]
MMIDTEGMDGPVVDLVTRFRAPREKLFRTWTDPKLISKWFMAVPGYLPALVETALQPLGAWKITVRPGDDGEPSVMEGNFFQVVPGRELAYSWRGNIPGGGYYTLVNARFEDGDGNGSRLRLTHGVFRSGTDRNAHAEGWTLCLQGLARLLGEEPDAL